MHHNIKIIYKEEIFSQFLDQDSNSSQASIPEFTVTLMIFLWDLSPIVCYVDNLSSKHRMSYVVQGCVIYSNNFEDL